MINLEDGSYLHNLDNHFDVQKESDHITIQSKKLNTTAKLLDYVIISIILLTPLLILIVVIYSIQMVITDISTTLLALFALILTFGSAFFFIFSIIVPFNEFYYSLHFTNEKVSSYRINQNGRKRLFKKIALKNIKMVTKETRKMNHVIYFKGNRYSLFVNSASDDEIILSTFIHLIYDLKSRKAINHIN